MSVDTALSVTVITVVKSFSDFNAEMLLFGHIRNGISCALKYISQMSVLFGGNFECPLITGVNVKVAVYVFSCFLFLSSSLCRLNIKHYSCCA